MNIHKLAFNSLITNLVCCTDTGYIIYGLDPGLEKKFTFDLGGIGIAKMLDKTNIILLVGGGNNPYKSKDTITMWDQDKKKALIEIDMKMCVKNTIIAKNIIVAITDIATYIFNWEGEIINHVSTCTNENGLCAINNEYNIIVTLGISKGEIAFWDYNNNNKPLKVIKAHSTNIVALDISKNGKLIVSASETGTLIRVFNTDTCNKIYEFRRGTQSADIYDLCFSTNSLLVACASSNGTIHIFELYDNINNTKNTQSSLSNLKNYLPDYFSSQWSFKQINIGNMSKSVCVFDKDDNLLIVTYNGYYYKIYGHNYSQLSSNDLYVNKK